jgi:hypothetical protein
MVALAAVAMATQGVEVAVTGAAAVVAKQGRNSEVAARKDHKQEGAQVRPCRKH